MQAKLCLYWLTLARYIRVGEQMVCHAEISIVVAVNRLLTVSGPSSDKPPVATRLLSWHGAEGPNLKAKLGLATEYNAVIVCVCVQVKAVYQPLVSPAWR